MRHVFDNVFVSPSDIPDARCAHEQIANRHRRDHRRQRLFPCFLRHSGNPEFLARQRASPCSDYTDGSSEKEIDVDDEMNLRRAVPRGTCKVHTMPPFFSFLLFFCTAFLFSDAAPF
jgi:hypothetical protein